MRAENYDGFLKEVIGLGWATRQLALQVWPRPSWRVEAGALVCSVECLGAKCLVERFGGADATSRTHDPNLGATWDVRDRWEGDALVSERRAASQNGQSPDPNHAWCRMRRMPASCILVASHSHMQRLSLSGGRPITTRRWLDEEGHYILLK